MKLLRPPEVQRVTATSFGLEAKALVQPSPVLQEQDREAHPIRYVLTKYGLAFRSKLPSPHPRFTGKEAKLVQGMIEQYGLDRVCKFVEQFFSMHDEWVADKGYTFTIFYSQIGKLIVKTTKPSRHPGINAE